MKKIQLSGKNGLGKFTLVDESDYLVFSKIKWNLSVRGYATHTVYKDGIKIGYSRLHSLIMQTPKGFDTDHINGDRLDNRRSNLRITTRNQNMMNAKKRINCFSKYKGVTFFAGIKSKPWRANIKNIHLGYFATEHQAALAYDLWAAELFGEFARLNFQRAGDQ